MTVTLFIVGMTILIAIIVIMIIYEYCNYYAAGSVSVNVALKHKAYPRNTTLPLGAPHKVELAVDGDKNTSSASCATTTEMDYSWWGVHLTNKTCVGYVNITTSADPGIRFIFWLYFIILVCIIIIMFSNELPMSSADSESIL